MVMGTKLPFAAGPSRGRDGKADAQHAAGMHPFRSKSAAGLGIILARHWGMSGSFSLWGLPPALAARAARVAPAIASAAERTGVDFRLLLETARLESGFNPEAKARTSSATGLFQFIDASWLETLARHGGKHGIDTKNSKQALGLRTNPEVASLMAAEFMADNGRTLEAALGRAASGVDLYLAHFLGAGGATRFLKRMQEAPSTIAADLFPKAAAANRGIFHGAQGPRSLADVHALFARKLGGDVPLSVPETGAPVPGVPASFAARLAAERESAGATAPDGSSRASDAALAAQAARLILAQLGA